MYSCSVMLIANRSDKISPLKDSGKNDRVYLARASRCRKLAVMYRMQDLQGPDAMNDLSPKPVLTVSVRDLVEFVLRRGDLGDERRFVKSDRALVGIRGHQKIQRSRPAGYQTETSVEHRVEAEGFTLHIRGRIDGVLAAPDELLLEEIKTVEGPWDQQGDALHWAQLKVYGFMFACDRSVS